MKRFLQTASAIALLTLVAGSVSAQFRIRMPSVAGVWNPVVGAGATYEMQYSDGTKRNVDVAIVGKESVDGSDAYWLEISMTARHGEGQGEVIIKDLFSRDGDTLTLRRAVIQMPGQPPMLMPDMMTQRMSSQDEPKVVDYRKNAEDLGKETVTTPAGTFDCEHFRAKDGSGDAWLAPNAGGPYGLVKSVSDKGRTTMVMVKSVTDAKDKITGTPQPFNPMGMGRPPQP
ncbi:MAG TPA: hypothetical protein VGR81_01810 [Candidatus Acidoferrales bacterium]|nr:hypothetical protein [Candidatus Acidoferrales bacterium]